MNDNSGHTVGGLVWRNYNYLAWKSYNLVCGCDECETDDRSRFENFIDSRNCSELYVDDSFLEDCSVESVIAEVLSGIGGWSVFNPTIFDPAFFDTRMEAE